MKKTNVVTEKNPLIPEGFMRLNIFIRPEFSERINQLSNRHGIRKYTVMDYFMKFYWRKFELSMDSNLESALNKMKEDVESGSLKK